MAPKASLSMLFHPKKGSKQEPQTSRKATTPRPKPPVEKEDDDGLKLPEGPFQEFRLLASTLNGWKYDVMKFDSRKPVDISKWTAPIKLNRKDLRRDEAAVTTVPQAVGPMLGPDGKPVIGADGKMVMVDAEGRPIHTTSSNAEENTPSSSKDKGKSTAANAKKRFQKKTRQVFYVPEEVRQLRREERYPWVMEDSSPAQNELWMGQLDDVSKAETYAFFMPAANDVFKFVPAHRWYKFQKKLKHDLPTDTANVESLYTLNQKRDPQAWLASRNGKGPSAATAAMFKASSEGRVAPGGMENTTQSLGPGGRKLKTVDSGMSSLFDDDEDGDVKRKKERELGEEGDLDEQEYEEDFADDEEKMEVDDNDEEAKETEERLKREYKAANKQRDTGIDDESDEEEKPGASKQEKAMQKLIRNREGNDAYESDEEKNPYASSEEESEEEVITANPALPLSQPPSQTTESHSQTPKPAVPRPQSNNGTGSRAASPALSPSLGGHSLVAKRATSPKAPKPKTIGASRGNSPLGSRATSPTTGSRATSPIDVNGGDSNGLPKSNKRKAEDVAHAVSPSPSGVTANGAAPKPKKRKAQAAGGPAVAVSATELEAMLVDWLKNTVNASTRDCIHHFTPYLTDGDKKTEFSAMVRKVAQLKNGVLVLRQRGSAAPSPAAPSAS